MSNELNDLDLKKPLLPDEYLFQVENITGTLEDYQILKKCLQKTAESSQLTSIDRSNLHKELQKMKTELLVKQKLYQEQFDKLKDWMKESFQVESPQVLLDHQAKVKEAEMATEESASQGNSKQHQRIRTLNQNKEVGGSKKEANSTEHPPVTSRASKNLSRMNQTSSSGTATTGGHGQKDLSAIKSKVPNQIPINVFWNYIEPFFKPIDEDDLKYLDDPSHVMDVAPFVIPPLGLHYEKLWYEQYGYIAPGSESSKRSSRILSEQNGRNQVQLRDRLLSALIDKDAQIPETLEDEEFGDEDVLMNGETDSIAAASSSSHSPSSVPLDDRLRASLSELGFTDLTSSRDYQENDEICIEMRSVQRQLREQIVINQYRKKRLAQFIRTKLSSQEFYSLIGDLDKQIDGIFQKRVKNAKKKKTSKGTDSALTAAPVVTNEISSDALQCLENRHKLLETFSGIVSGRIDSLCPSNLVEFDGRVEEAILESARKSSKWLPLPEIALKQPLTSSQPAFPNSR